jgi:hypothetical protein
MRAKVGHARARLSARLAGSGTMRFSSSRHENVAASTSTLNALLYFSVLQIRNLKHASKERARSTPDNVLETWRIRGAASFCQHVHDFSLLSSVREYPLCA